MAVRIGGFPVWVGPSDVIDGAKAVMGWTDEALGVMASLPERATGLLDQAEALLTRVTSIADRIDTVLADVDVLVKRIEPLLVEVRAVADGAATIVARAGQVADGAADVVTGAGVVADEARGIVAAAGAVAADAGGVILKATGVADRALVVVEQAAGAATGASDMLAVYQPIAERAAPLAQRFVQEFSEEELHAAIRLVDHLPQLTEHVETDIMPILVTLDRVGPDLHELLNVVKDLQLAIRGIPGLRMLRRRGEGG
jgi:uncharacterized protein YoxC